MDDKEKKKKYNREYYLKNKEKLLPKARIRSVKWCKENKDYRNARDRARRLRGATPNMSATKKYRAKLKKECIDAYGGKCSCCGESNVDMLTMDHKLNNGSEHRKTFKSGGGAIHLIIKRENFPTDKYQCLCFNCNFSRYINKGICSHIKTDMQ